MKTVQMTLDEELLEKVDEAAAELGTSRSAFTRRALALALARRAEEQLEARHRAGYLRRPVEPGEFSDWEGEQAWGD